MKNFPARMAGHDIELRLLGPWDEAAFHELTNDPTIANTISFLSFPVERRVTDDWIARNEGAIDRIYGIFASDGTLIGHIAAHLDSSVNEVEIGYWIGDCFTGHGVATRAVSVLVDIINRHSPDRIVFAECLPSNEASMRVLTKNGFRDTGKPGQRAGRMRLVWRNTHFDKPDRHSLK